MGPAAIAKPCDTSSRSDWPGIGFIAHVAKARPRGIAAASTPRQPRGSAARLAQQAVRNELDRAATAAGIGHLTPHQLRHTYATALVNAGVYLQSLMALLGHVSAQVSLRYGKLFDTTVRTEYERALTLSKDHLAALPTTPAGTKPCPWPTSPAARTGPTPPH